MASQRTSHSEMPHPKSPKAQGTDVEAELGIHPVRRPMDIEHDVNDLGQKKRVSSVLTSPMFKEELETVVTDLLRSGDGGGHVIAREIANMLSPFNRSQYSLGVGCVSPINDITGSDTSLYSKGEKLMRCKLAALYRIVDLNGWSQSIYNHISLRVNQEHEHFLINPFGLLYHEVSASKLLKINMQGEVMDKGSTTFSLNKPGFILHSAIHSARPDLKCIIHVHTPEVIAVSLTELLPISQEAMIVGEVSYHNYQGLVVDQKEKKMLVKHLGPNNKVMFLRNHGLIACGETVEEAFHYLYHVMLACQTQVKVMSCSKHDKVAHLDKSLRAKTHDVVINNEETIPVGENAIKWGVGEMMFEANMRMLDNMGYRTGYSYRNISTLRKSRGKSDVESPGTAYGHAPFSLDDIQEGRLRLQSHPPQSRWVNSPNQYTKVKTISEEGSAPGSGHGSMNGDMSPKSKTKWRNEEGSSHGTPIRIADPNQFVPKNTDPREVAEKRKKIRGQGRWDETRPGPQSQKLESVGPTERRGPPQDGIMTGSKGIIQRDFHDVQVVTGPPNPFAHMSEEELKEYRKEVEQKTKKESESEEAPEVFEREPEPVKKVEEIAQQVTETAADEVDGATGTVPSTETEDPVPPEQAVVNGDEEPKVAQEVEFAPPITVTQPSPPQTDERKLENEEKTEKSPPKQKSTPPASPKEDKLVKKEKHSEKKSKTHKTPPASPKEEKHAKKEKHTEEKKSKTHKKGNDEETVVSPKSTKDPEPSKETPEGKDDHKGKNKKSKKRRSLSFLKKGKEKKEKE